MTRVLVLGGGPAGVGAALRLREEKKAEVVVLERGTAVGGNAGSFEWNGHRLDFGSHRLHPSCKPRIMADIRRLLGDDLLDRPRHGRIRLLGRWVHFPLKAADLALHAPPSFVVKSAIDAAAKPLRRAADGPESFASVLQKSLGPTICRDFYFPYARKMWGADPSALAAVQARRRVSASTPLKLLKKILSQVPGLKAPGAGRFFYPRGGFGRISEAYAKAAGDLGADIRLGHSVTRIEMPRSAGAPWRVKARHAGGETDFEAEHLWSTIPVTLLARMLDPAPPEDVLAATKGISYRAMTLVYLELPVDQFTEFDAHYFPAADVRITRLSETRNYGLVKVPAGRTVICAEIPCAVGDAIWTAKDEDLGRLLAEDLAHSGIPLPVPARAVHVARLPQAYPIYMTGYEPSLEKLDGYVSGIERLLSYGRQGLFAHDNTHHALAMAYAAVDCLADGRFDVAKWDEHRREFATHVVED
jgi:protoporphyrinogen oxidase